ncbi:protease modulator HflK [Pseudemcibacter aquimaris]|uniref:protease modulator HflK n=1 Tax=Pseudemcibacter aquimaris TaxID=2857064 RepID=UPI002013412D|nr:protease modulator HflK [Pseudemcibacter aquimaris]MCC3860338.1 protease modulator HflK [Pseudemcibacter aquimaris]WDU57664.1 protease modulator HflK [Pseudemcibacter aquimaris]
MVKKILYGLGALLLPLYAVSGFYAVEPEETAVTYIFGKMIDKNVEAGIHWNVPYPFGSQTVKTTKANLILSVGETAPPLESFTYGAQNLWMTGGASLVEIQVDIQYTITRLDLFETSHDRPEVFLDFMAQKMLTRSLVEKSVDDILTTGRQLLGSQIRQAMQVELDNANTGIQVQDVIVKSLSPPSNDGVADSFQLVQNANSDRYRRIELAESQKNQVLFDAEVEATRIRNEGMAAKFARLESAKGDVARFNGLAAEWQKSPEAMERRIYLEEMADILRDVKVYVVPNNSASNVIGNR